MAIQNLANDMAIIKRNTSKDDDINGNDQSHLCVLDIVSCVFVIIQKRENMDLYACRYSQELIQDDEAYG